MKRTYRSNWIKHLGERPAPVPWNRAGCTGLTNARAPAPIVKTRMSNRVPEEFGLTLRPPHGYRTILVPVDGDPFGEHALPLALGLARRAGAEVRVIHVHCLRPSALRPERLYSESNVDALLRERQVAYLNDLVRRIRKVTSVAVTPIFLQGRDVADSLCEATSAGADLVVMATHHRSLLGHFWFGSVADDLVRRLSIPILLVRGFNAPADLTGDPLIRKILVPLDGSDVAERVLQPALSLGALMGADHTLLRVLPWTPSYSLGYPAGGLKRSLSDVRRAEAWDYLLRVTNRLKDREFRVDPRLVQDEATTAKAILDYARNHDVDLIGLTTRGGGRLARLFRGSVADRVVRGANVPVLLCRANVEEAEALKHR